MQFINNTNIIIYYKYMLSQGIKNNIMQLLLTLAFLLGVCGAVKWQFHLLIAGDLYEQNTFPHIGSVWCLFFNLD